MKFGVSFLNAHKEIVKTPHRSIPTTPSSTKGFSHWNLR